MTKRRVRIIAPACQVNRVSHHLCWVVSSVVDCPSDPIPSALLSPSTPSRQRKTHLVHPERHSGAAKMQLLPRRVKAWFAYLACTSKLEGVCLHVIIVFISNLKKMFNP